MKILVKFSCPEVLGCLKNGSYELPDGSNIRELLLICEKECEFKVDDNHLKWLLVLVNGRQTNWTASLTDGNEVQFLRGAMGG